MDTIPNLTFTVPNLKSGAHKWWKKAFTLDEHTLRHLYRILDNYENQLPEKLIIVFEVKRKDNRFYETADFEEVLTDPNISPKTISALSIGLLYPPGTVMQPDFDEGFGVVNIHYDKREHSSNIDPQPHISFSIANENRDWALSLADEIEPHIIQTFNNKRIPQLMPLILLLPLLMFAGSIANSAVELFVFAPVGILGIGVMIAIAAVIRQIEGPGWVNRWFGPESVFLWGDEGQRYLIRESKRHKVKWGIIIGFVVSVVISGILLLQ